MAIPRWLVLAKRKLLLHNTIWVVGRSIPNLYRVFFLTGPPLKMSLDWPPANLLGLAPLNFLCVGISVKTRVWTKYIVLWSYVDSLVNRNSISLPDVSRLRDGSMSLVGWWDGQVGQIVKREQATFWSSAHIHQVGVSCCWYILTPTSDIRARK